MPDEHSPGFRFKDGKLYAFTSDRVMVMESWPALRAVRKTAPEPWQEFTPVFRIVRPYRRKKRRTEPQLEFGFAAGTSLKEEPSLSDQRRHAFDQFRFSLPKPVAARAEKFQNRQWALLRLFQAREETLELAAQNPALCFALANHRHFNERRAAFETVVKTSSCRMREIAGCLGFPRTDGAVRILGKLAPESASVELLRPLRKVLELPDAAKMLAHLPKLNAGVLAIVVDPQLRAASTPQLLAEIADVDAEKYSAATAALLDQTIRMTFTIRPQRGTPRIQSRERLQAMHDEVSVEYRRHNPPVEESVALPRAPLRGTPDIIPIHTVGELIAEGRDQDNCVATYIDQVRKRRVFIYRVLKPERATLSIVRGTDGVGLCSARNHSRSFRLIG